MEALHDTAVAKAVSDLLVADSPELFFALELYFVQADGLLLGHQLVV